MSVFVNRKCVQLSKGKHNQSPELVAISEKINFRRINPFSIKEGVSVINLSPNGWL